MSTEFSYGEFTTRNIGFVSEDEQARLQGARVFIAGVGGMGSAALACLVRSGVGSFVFADIDRFEISNLNRQMFASLDTVGTPKTEATAEAIARLNPECKVEILGAEWVDRLDEILPDVDVAINGCDSARATIALMRAARRARKTVIDAFASPLPSVYVVGPDDPRPEQTFGYPTVDMPIDAIDAGVAAQCLQKEIEWVMVHSSSAAHVHMGIAGQVVAGKRSRMSFAPMVWSTGCLMAYEAIRSILRRPGGPGPRGLFFNPWTHRVERPRHPLVAALRRMVVRRYLRQLAAGSESA